MKMSEVVTKIVQEGQYCLIKVSKVQLEGFINYDVWNEEYLHSSETEELLDRKIAHEKKPRGYVMVDAFTASGLHQIFQNLSPDMQEKFDRLSLEKLTNFLYGR